MAWGLLLINLGTPDAPEIPEVRRYLDEFLMDPRVMDLSPLGRLALVKLAILPFRPKESAAAYKEVWTERGSPLLFHAQDLADAVQKELGDEAHVEIAMRYQSPSIDQALEAFRRRGIDQIVALPLFPQYSSAATGSAVEKLWSEALKRWNTPALVNIPEFYDHPGFIEAFRAIAAPRLEALQPDRVLFSFHGLPERHCTKSDESEGQSAHCFASNTCCDTIVQANRRCYRAQCFATARALADALQLADGTWEISFQSRLGRDPWIRPYTDERVLALPGEGVKKLAVFSPAFVADCLETLEELGMRAAEDFKTAGGETLELITSLNSTEPWVKAVVDMTLSHVPPAWRT